MPIHVSFPFMGLRPFLGLQGSIGLKSGLADPIVQKSMPGLSSRGCGPQRVKELWRGERHLEPGCKSQKCCQGATEVMLVWVRKKDSSKEGGSQSNSGVRGGIWDAPGAHSAVRMCLLQPRQADPQAELPLLMDPPMFHSPEPAHTMPLGWRPFLPVPPGLG